MASILEELSNKKVLIIPLVLLILTVILLSAPLKKEEKEVVVYVSHDQDLSEPIINEFEKSSGINVKALYDTETSKTVGLVNRLVAEKSNPQADIFWNNEATRTILLKKQGILEPYCSPNANDITETYKDSECYWTGFGARARVILYNKNFVSEAGEPKSIFDFLNPAWKGKICMGNPLLGSTSDYIAALFASLGDENAKDLLLKLRNNSMQILESNSMVRNQVVLGNCWVGLTDTDDAYHAVNENKSVKMIFSDQSAGEIGDLILPNTVMMIKGAKHQEEAKMFIDFILSSKVEEDLEKSALQMPLKKSSTVFENIPNVKDIKPINATSEQIEEKLNSSNSFLQDVFIR